MNPFRMSRNADLIFTVHAPIPEAELARLRQQIQEHFSGHRAIIVRADEMTITPIERRYKRSYRPSMLAHGGRHAD